MHPLETLEFSSRVAKRAQYEAFEFTITPAGVCVRNCSHANPEDHEYVVTIEDGLPSHCTCPADREYDGACKHRVGVAIRRPVLDAAILQPDSVACDGGGKLIEEPDSPDKDEEPAESDCDECIGEFPCWDCYRSGRKAFPE